MNFPDGTDISSHNPGLCPKADGVLGDRICDSVLAGFEEIRRMMAQMFSNFLAEFLLFPEYLTAKLVL
jgi:hypothetical protein